MSIHSILPLFGSIFAIITGLTVLIKIKKYFISLPFFLFCLSIFVWLFSYSIVYSIKNIKLIIIGCNLACTAVVFTSPTAYHFISNYLRIKKLRQFIWIFYILMGLLTYLFLSTKYFLNTPTKHFWGYYSKAGPLHPIYLIFHFTILSLAFTLLYKALKRKDLFPNEKLKIKYIALVYTLAAFGGIDFLPKYGFEIYPFGSIFVLLFIGVTAYAILKHRLMDIRIAITRATIFIFVYSLVFAVPVVLYLSTKLWLLSIILMGILSPIGMFVYSYLREQVENVVYREQERYQAGIRQLGQRLTNITDTDDLLKEVVLEINKLVSPQFYGLYVYSNKDNSYVLNRELASENYNFKNNVFLNEHKLIEVLRTQRSTILIETVFLEDFPFETIAIPFYTKLELFGFLILGPKPKKSLYTKPDFTAFDILSFQVSLALQNIQYLQELKRSQLELLRQENLKFVSLLVKGLAHEILNPLTPLMHRIEDLEGEVLLELYNIYEKTQNQDLKETLLSLRQTTKSLKENASHIHLIIDTLHKLQKGDVETIGPLDLKSFFKDVIPLLSIEVDPKIQENVIINQEIDRNLPPIRANAVLLKQVFINLYKNACEAMITSQNKSVKIEARLDNNDSNFVIIEFSDTGGGIPSHILPNLFNRGITTKGEKGSGIGLNQVKTIIEKFGGSIEAKNKEEGGAKFIIRLCVFKS